jgi:hypothetical protein
METTKQPYEFLARWDQSGRLVGAHVQWRYVTTENGEVVAEGVTAAEPVAVSGNAGFPLSDLIGQTATDALAAADAAMAERDAMKAEREAALERLAKGT